MNMVRYKDTMSKRSYGGKITCEQFCFYEMRVVARLILEGKTEDEIVSAVVEDNLFQYPTERTVARIAKACYQRLMSLNDMELVNTVATEFGEAARQICLYGMMKCYPVVWDFMIQVIGEKYRTLDMTFGPVDINSFFQRVQSDNDEVAGWSDLTVQKVKQVLRKTLVENEYIDSVNSDHLNLVLIDSQLENAIRANGDLDALLAFNCMN